MALNDWKEACAYALVNKLSKTADLRTVLDKRLDKLLAKISLKRPHPQWHTKTSAVPIITTAFSIPKRDSAHDEQHHH